MPKKSDRRYSVLIVSGSEAFDSSVRRVLAGKRTASVVSCRNAVSARRRCLEEKYDLVVVNCPLPDEFGHDFAMDVSERDNAAVLVAVPAEVYDTVADHVLEHGIGVVIKPVREDQLDRSVRFMGAICVKMLKLEDEIRKANEKTEEMRIVGKAKSLLMRERGMTEDQAHRLIGKEAMDQGVSRGKIAVQILEDLRGFLQNLP